MMEFNAKNLYTIALAAREEMRERLTEDIGRNYNDAVEEICDAAADGNMSTVFTIDGWNDYTEGELACIKTEVSKMLREDGLLTFKGDNPEDMIIRWGKEAQN